MSFSTFSLSKSWESADDFPTFESDESQVRADMQFLFDELKDDLNTHVSEETAENISFPYSEDIPAYNVRGAIEDLKGQLDNAVFGSLLPDNSVTTAKIVDANITTDKIADASVTTAKLADNSVTTAKLVDANVTTAKIADANVTNAKIANATITKDKIADGQVAKLTSGRIDPAVLPLAAAKIEANKTLAAADNGYFFRITGNFTVTVPVNGSVSLPVGFEVQLFNYAPTALIDATGCSLYSAEGIVLTQYQMSKYEFVTLKKFGSLADNTWVIEGSAFIPGNTIGTGHIVNGNVTTAKIADANVTADKLASNAVTTAKIANANVTADKLASNAVTTAKITDANVTTAKLASNAVTTAKITDANVTTAKIADGNVTFAKLASAAIGSSNPNMDGTASAGSASSLSRSDHRHPHDTYSTGLILDYNNNVYSSLPSTSGQTKGRIVFVLV